MRGPVLRKLERFKIVSEGYMRIFRDPYHQGSDVGLIAWILREIDELIYGEL